MVDAGVLVHKAAEAPGGRGQSQPGGSRWWRPAHWAGAVDELGKGAAWEPRALPGESGTGSAGLERRLPCSGRALSPSPAGDVSRAFGQQLGSLWVVFTRSARPERSSPAGLCTETRQVHVGAWPGRLDLRGLGPVPRRREDSGVNPDTGGVAPQGAGGRCASAPRG